MILDGLDEYRTPLDLGNKVIRSISEKTSAGNVLVNVIQDNLLPDAKQWLTTHPAAASQILQEYIDMVTKIRGFNDHQKEVYFRSTFSHDRDLADKTRSSKLFPSRTYTNALLCTGVYAAGIKG